MGALMVVAAIPPNPKAASTIVLCCESRRIRIPDEDTLILSICVSMRVYVCMYVCVCVYACMYVCLPEQTMAISSSLLRACLNARKYS